MATLELKTASAVNHVIELRDGRIACGCFQGQIEIWNTESGTREMTLEGHEGGVHSLLQWSADRLISASEDRTLKIWNLTTGECVETLQGHTDVVHAVCKAGEEYIASGSFDRTVRIWRMDSHQIECVTTTSCTI